MVVSNHTHTVQLQGSDLVLPITGGQIDISETSVPMISGSVTFAITDQLSIINQLMSYDPRSNTRAWVTSVQRFGNGRTVADISSLFPVPQTAAAVTTAWTGYQAKDVSNSYGEPYNSFGMRQSTRQTVDVAVQSVAVNFKMMEGSIRFAGREQIAIDFKNVNAPVVPGTLSLREIVSNTLTLIGEILSLADTEDYEFSIGSDPDLNQIELEALTWEVGQSAWDYMNVLVNAAGLRLYADESGIWHLAAPFGQKTDNGILNYSLASLLDFNYEVTREDQWYDGVLLEYEWTDDLDVRHREFDFAGNTGRVLHEKYADRVFPGYGAAGAIANRASARGVSITARAISDYFAQVGKTVGVDLGTHVLAGLISSIQFNFADGTMEVRTRDSLQTIDINAWILAPDGYSWDEIVPVIPWDEADATDFDIEGEV